MSKKNRFNKPASKPETVVAAPSYDVPQESVIHMGPSKKVKAIGAIVIALAVAFGIAYALTPKADVTPVTPRPELVKAEENLTEEPAAVEETIAVDIAEAEENLTEELTEADKEILRN